MKLPSLATYPRHAPLVEGRRGRGCQHAEHELPVGHRPNVGQRGPPALFAQIGREANGFFFTHECEEEDEDKDRD